MLIKQENFKTRKGKKENDLNNSMRASIHNTYIHYTYSIDSGYLGLLIVVVHVFVSGNAGFNILS